MSQLERGLSWQLPRFLGVGACGFLTDVGVFSLLGWLDEEPLSARVVSASIAITLTWYLNRLHVFQTSGHSAHGPEYLRYLTVQAFGLIVNFGTFLFLLSRGGIFAELPLLALCGGAALAIAFNFLGSRYWAYRPAGE